MRLNRLDLNLLICLDALLAECNVSKAAARVFLSQPAMSIALRRLREHFGDELLVQTGRTYRPTSFAVSLQNPVRDMVLQMRALADLRPNFNPLECDRRVRIESSDYVCSILMTRVFERAAREAPHMQFDLRLLESDFIEKLESGEVDILVIPESVGSRNHPRELLFSDTFSCVVWEGNTQIGARITPEQYLQLGHVVTEFGGGRLASLDQMELVHAGYQRRCDITCPSYALSPRFVIGTQRIATVQTRLAVELAKAWPLRVLPCPIKTPTIVETVQWHRHQETDGAILWLLELLKRVGKELGEAPVGGERRARQRGARVRGRTRFPAG